MNRSKRLERSQYRRWFLSITLIALSILGLWTEGRTTHGHAPLSSDLEASSQIIYVNAAAIGNNNGASWADAYTSLQIALTNAVSGQELWVVAGVYKPTTNPSARTIAFQLKNGVAVYGGFAGTETARDQRNWTANRTILSGDIDNNDITSSGVVTNPANINGSNSYHVVSGSNTDTTAVIDGVIITAGQANGSSSPNEHGGGMYNNGGSPTISNVIFSGNSTGGRGGGMYNYGSSPELYNVTFTANSSSNFGGGLANDNISNPSLTNVVFNGNNAEDGGGMFNSVSSPTLTNVTFSGNSASANTGSGGGMYNSYSNPTLTNGTLNGNSAARAGGMFNLESSPTLTNVTFSGNRATSNEGGGMYSMVNSTPTLTNVTFSGNRANTKGGGMSRGITSQAIVIRNSIFWNNQDNSGVGTATASVGSFGGTIYYSMVQGCNPLGTWQIDYCGTNGGGNLHDNDPLLMDAPMPGDAPTLGGNLRLQAGSVALNTGYNAYNNKSTDLAGNVRIINGIIDLGAYERVSTVCPGAGVRYVHKSANAPGDGLSWSSAYRDLQDALQVVSSCEVWIAVGLHKPIDNPVDRTATFQLKNGVAIYGGFAGTETEREQRDWRTHWTVLSGDIDNNDIAPSGIVASASEIVGDNSYHVVTGSGVDQTAVLDGVIITAGQANGASADPCDQRCGGGMFNVAGIPRLANIIFSGNRAQQRGGGIYNRTSSPTLGNVTFRGGMATWGGGMGNWDNSTPTLTNVVFSGNRASSHGGGLYNRSSSPKLFNVSFSGNHVDDSGGAIYNNDNSHPTLTNVTVSGNSAQWFGGGMFNYGNSNPTVHNSIFWHNRANGVTNMAAASVHNESSTPGFHYSLVQGCNPGGSWVSACGSNGNHNLADADPKFVATPDPAGAPTTAGNLRLQAGSPAIDKGDDNANGSSRDLAGNPRKAGKIDLGAYEYHSIIIGVSASPAAGGTVSGGGAVDHGATVTLQATAKSGYSFVNWTEGSAVVSNSPNYSFEATASRTLVANFTKMPASSHQIYLPLVTR
jgi:hypothetical protein